MDQSSFQSPSIPLVRYLYIAFFVCAALVIVSDQSVIFGSNDLVKGVETSDNALDYVENLFNGLVTYGDTLETDGTQLDTLYNQAYDSGCQDAQDLIDEMPLYFEYIGEYQSFVDPVPGECSTVSDELHKYGTQYKNSSMWSLYGTVLLGVALYTAGLFFRSTLVLQLSVGFVQLLSLTLFILCGVEMVILVSFLSLSCSKICD